MTQQSVFNDKLRTNKSEVNLIQTKSHSSPASMMNMLVNRSKVLNILSY